MTGHRLVLHIERITDEKRTPYKERPAAAVYIFILYYNIIWGLFRDKRISDVPGGRSRETDRRNNGGNSQ